MDAPLPTRDQFLANKVVAEHLMVGAFECPVCYEQTDSPFETECNHVFCIECADTWFEKESTCPVCRTPLYAVPAITAQADDANEQFAATQHQQQVFVHPNGHDVRRLQITYTFNASWIPIDMDEIHQHISNEDLFALEGIEREVINLTVSLVPFQYMAIAAAHYLKPESNDTLAVCKIDWEESLISMLRITRDESHRYQDEGDGYLTTVGGLWAMLMEAVMNDVLDEREGWPRYSPSNVPPRRSFPSDIVALVDFLARWTFHRQNVDGGIEYTEADERAVRGSVEPIAAAYCLKNFASFRNWSGAATRAFLI